ncbi:MAG: MoaD/ThiS family protein [Ignavibacteria bacterium]
MKVEVLFFGVLSEITGKKTLTFNDIADTKELNDKLIGEYPEMKSVTYRIAVNQKITNANTKLNDGDEIAFMPPFAGG